MSTQSRWIAAAMTTVVAALAMGQASAQSYYDSGYTHSNGYGYGNTRVVRCDSNGSRTTYCRVNTQGTVRLSRQISHSPCRQGRSWGTDSRGIWVSNGCRAEFAISSRHEYRRDDEYGRSDYRDGDNYRNSDNGYNNGYNGYNSSNSYNGYNSDSGYNNDDDSYYYRQR